MARVATVTWTPGAGMVAGRRAAGLTQEDLAELLTGELGKNYDSTTVSRMETGRRGIDWRELRALQTIFGWSADYILNGPRHENRDMGRKLEIAPEPGPEIASVPDAA